MNATALAKIVRTNLEIAGRTILEGVTDANYGSLAKGLESADETLAKMTATYSRNSVFEFNANGAQGQIGKAVSLLEPNGGGKNLLALEHINDAIRLVSRLQ